MENEETFKNKIKAENALIKPRTEFQNLDRRQKDKFFYDDKEKSEKSQVKLTIEELRSCEGFETVSESEGQEIIESLFQLAVIVYNF